MSNPEHKATVCIYSDRNEKEQWQAIAKQQDISLSRLIIRAVRLYVEQLEK
jgi:hypothetical protein